MPTNRLKNVYQNSDTEQRHRLKTVRIGGRAQLFGHVFLNLKKKLTLFWSISILLLSNGCFRHTGAMRSLHSIKLLNIWHTVYILNLW